MVSFFDFIGWKGASYVEKEQQFEEEGPFVPDVHRGFFSVHNGSDHGSRGDRGDG